VRVTAMQSVGQAGVPVAAAAVGPISVIVADADVAAANDPSTAATAMVM
jgi:hypothetical protein